LTIGPVDSHNSEMNLADEWDWKEKARRWSKRGRTETTTFK